MRATMLARRLERPSDLSREHLKLLPGGKVPALVGLVEIGEGGGTPSQPSCAGPGRSRPGNERDGSLFRRTWVSTSMDWITTAEDRKSTRLNSSHMSISYAVFCLKKKSG